MGFFENKNWQNITLVPTGDWLSQMGNPGSATDEVYFGYKLTKVQMNFMKNIVNHGMHDSVWNIDRQMKN